MLKRKLVGGFPAYQGDLALMLKPNEFEDFEIAGSGRAALSKILSTFSPEQTILWLPSLWCPYTDSSISNKYAAFTIRRYSYKKFGRTCIENDERKGRQVVVVDYRPFSMDFELVFPEGAVVIRDTTHEPFGTSVDCDFEFRSLRKLLPVSSGAIFRPMLESSRSVNRVRLTLRSLGQLKPHLALKTQFSKSLTSIAYSLFRKNEKMIDIGGIGFSEVSEFDAYVLRHSDLAKLHERRLKNFEKLSGIFAHSNLWEIGMRGRDGALPFTYPIFSEKSIEHREFLRKAGIFTAQYWSDIRRDKLSILEKDLVDRTIHLPLGSVFSKSHLKSLAALSRRLSEEQKDTDN